MMSNQIRPNRLQVGSRIGIVNPSYWLEAERRQRAIGVLEGLGNDIVLGKSTTLKQDQYAGSAEERAADIMAMFADPSIGAIVCARGGYGGNRVLPLLDYDAIRKNPKIFIGFSDITAYLSSISQRSRLVTFHGPMLTTFGTETLQYNLDNLQKVLSGESDIQIHSPETCRARVLKPGIARGPLWGGNLMLVNNRLGTPDQIDTRGAILFIEEIGEKLYAFDRLMMHLKLSGSLQHVSGLIVGELTEMGDSMVPFGKSTDEIVLDVCSDYSFPIISNFPCGHGTNLVTLPVSHNVELHAQNDDPFLLIPESPVA